MVLTFLILILRFTEKENISGIIQAKGTVIKAIRTSLIENYPYIENYIDEILPKKDNVRIVKWYAPFFFLLFHFSNEILFQSRAH